MSIGIHFQVEHWAAWAPGLTQAEDWSAWARGERTAEAEGKPALPFIDPLLRRRLSRLSRLALQVAYDSAEGRHDRRTVFASRHGEIHRTRDLLADLAADEALSPMGFSLSVHNTASGLYSIASGNQAPSTAIAAGRDTLAMALIEAVGQSQRHGEAVLLVYANEPLPADYTAFADETALPLGLALRISAACDQESTWSLQATNTSENHDHGPVLCPGLTLLQLLAGDTPEALHAGERGSWRWSKPA